MIGLLAFLGGFLEGSAEVLAFLSFFDNDD
jgi:hypothetical protein